MLEHETGDHRVEARICERQRRRARAPVHRSPAPLGRDDDLGVGRVDADDERRAGTDCEPRDLALPASDVEHPSRAGEVGRCEREDLLGVLRVGAVGEAVLPPASVDLPELVAVGVPGHERAAGTWILA